MAIISIDTTTNDSDLEGPDVLLLHLLSELRDQARAVHGTSEIAGWAHAIDERVLLALRSGDLETARSIAQERLGLPPMPQG